MTTFAPGSLVLARGREWVVQPDSQPDLLLLRPLGGTEDEVAGLLPALEPVAPASFDLPDPSQPGDHRSSRLLREAARLGFRNSTGPFRSFASLAVEPRPYQLVPLMLALRLDPVRLLIADDVGIGKTVEALLVAKELLERGEANGLTVLCPPHLAEQWQVEMRDKFNLAAELVLPATVSRLERERLMNQSIFERFRFTVVSTDYIKSDRRREDFLRSCPDLVIVDEAHTCAGTGPGSGKGRHQRHQLIAGLARTADRHLILVTATPHSGNEDAFRALLGFLHEDFLNLPEDLGGKAAEGIRRRLAAHLVQRRRGDLKSYLATETPFPEREEAEETYTLSREHRELIDSVLAYAREIIADTTGGTPRQRVRWWSALALLRTLSSSPAAAAATLRSRASTLGVEDESIDAVGQRSVLDQGEEDLLESLDVTPGADWTEESPPKARLLKLAERADAIRGKKDAKLQRVLKLVGELLKEGFKPILFCRFIHTAEYLAEELRGALKSATVDSVTGLLPPADREARVVQLAQAERPVLIATDCLSEGINLQQWFNAVVHYDLSWNPTRHEQREGRVDRFNQASARVRVLTYYGSDNPVDGIVLDVLLKKHKAIRTLLGISVPVPADPNKVVEAVMEGLVLRGRQPRGEQLLLGFDTEELHTRWQEAGEREKRSQTMFAQHALKPDEVARELEAVRKAMGSGHDVRRFVLDALRLHGARIEDRDRVVRFHLAESPRGLQEAMGDPGELRACFELPAPEEAVHLHRTHPAVEGLAAYVLDSSLDPLGEGKARRASAIRTRGVRNRTALFLLRQRYHVVTEFRGGGVRGGAPPLSTGLHRPEHRLLAEELGLAALEGSPASPTWLSPEQAEALLDLEPDSNLHPDQARDFLRRFLEELPAVRPELESLTRSRAGELLESHRRVRVAAAHKGVQHRVEPQLPVDILGVYLFYPA